MKKETFNIKFKSLIISGKAKLTLNGYTLRVVCWDRKHVYPNIGLIDFGDSESVVEFDDTGKAHILSTDSVSYNLYVGYDPIGITKNARVVYSLLRCPYIEKYMEKYGYVNVEEKGFYYNAVEFANKYAKTFTNELHNDLKKDGNWEYDDDYDWE